MFEVAATLPRVFAGEATFFCLAGDAFLPRVLAGVAALVGDAFLPRVLAGVTALAGDPFLPIGLWATCMLALVFAFLGEGDDSGVSFSAGRLAPARESCCTARCFHKDYLL